MALDTALLMRYNKGLQRRVDAVWVENGLPPRETDYWRVHQLASVLPGTYLIAARPYRSRNNHTLLTAVFVVGHR